MKYRIFLFQILFLAISYPLFSAVIKGKITDSSTGEPLIGATIYISAIRMGTVSGLDGSYIIRNIPAGSYKLDFSFIGYQTLEKKIVVNENDIQNLNVALSPQANELEHVVISASAANNTDISARNSEKLSSHILSIVSAKTIEISPDLTVANVAQRISGITIERSSTGDGQYALLRGMDKRFNYTMVNGVKIPSPDNKNRFIPLDIFPSELLDRLEVTKSLTADMAGDGIGGAVNMVMKDAPSRLQLTANLATGYNTLFLKNDYRSFDISSISKKSPSEKYGLAYPVQMKDFSTKNLYIGSGKGIPNLMGGFSAGERFFKDRIGIIIAGSYQSTTRANSSNMYSASMDNNGLQSVTNRFYSNRQARSGIHIKLDAKLSPDHKLIWYNAYMDMANAQVRDAISYNSRTTRLRWDHQYIMNSTLKGYHTFHNPGLSLDWALSYGKALNETPDNVQVNELIINGMSSIDQNDGASRRWEHNTDKDIIGKVNLGYSIRFLNGSVLDLSTGAEYSDKVRDSFFNEYHFKPYDESKTNPRELIRSIDYKNLDEIKYSVNTFGNLSDPLNYGATEKIGAGYLMGKLSFPKLLLIAGLRAEHTNQGYNLMFVTEGARNEGNQKYIDVLPGLGMKYQVHNNANLRLTYYKAINRPSFFEIVPYSMIYEEYKERGNPDLKHTRADNLDLRYEYFPTPSEQFMAGIFYKNIKDPIEFGMMNGFGQDVFYMPMNFGNANNYGLEIDIIKYFSLLGIKANYTYTDSDITTTKMRVIENPDQNAETNIITEYVNQTRPLYGQAEHVVNLSILFRDKQYGWDGQLAFAYTGSRLVIVSRYIDQDIWQAGYATLDASMEKRFASKVGLFVKASNILNAPMIQFVKKNEMNASIADVKRHRGGIVEREEYYGMNFSIGIKYRFY